uniref:Zinc finger PHD-type domain-containing protein n=1 Tax=Cacopsylla melanoneura TaxID=428564 RepID=A0A8D8QH80_9HEMI
MSQGFAPSTLTTREIYQHEDPPESGLSLEDDDPDNPDPIEVQAELEIPPDVPNQMVMNHEVEIPMVISQEPEISADPGSTNDLTSPPPSFLTPSPTNSAGKSFRDILVTPHGSKGSSKKPRRKALNSSAVVVTKCLFKQTKASNKRKNLKKTSKSKHYQPSLQDLSDAGSSNVNLGDPSSWYCKVCQEDRELDMRLCASCLKYVHEECVGLTKVSISCVQIVKLEDMSFRNK